MSGLFVRPPNTFSYLIRDRVEGNPPDYEKKRTYQEQVAKSFNMLICELAFFGIVSEPAAPAQIAYGRSIDGHAVITRGHGGREIYGERQLEPRTKLMKGETFDWITRSEVSLIKALRLSSAKQLANISESLPSLIAGAYSQFSQGQLSEALIISWIVSEQILSHLWKKYRTSLPDTDEPGTKKDEGRKKRLEDNRTYSASVRAEVLLTAGHLEIPLYNQIQKARKYRNDLAHDAKISINAAKHCLVTMKAAIEFLCDTTIEPPLMTEQLGW